MKSSNYYFAMSAVLLLFVANTGSNQQVAAALSVASLLSSELEPQPSKLARTDPELEAESLRPQTLAPLRRNTWPDVATLIQAAGQRQQQQQQPELKQIRLRRSPINSQLAAQFASGNYQQMLEDEQTMRRVLPELIAQARHDKNLERALIKMLIDTSLRSTLSGVAGPSAGNLYNGRAIDMGEGGLNGFQPQYSSPLEQVLDEFAGLEANSADATTGGQPSEGRFLGNQLDKREYMKPCSFNAVSCAKNPFRKLLLKN